MKRLLSLLMLAALLPACATITTGTTQNVSIITEPPGATCQLLRSGNMVAVVNPTPGTANVSKSGQDLAVNCTRPGSMPAVQTVSSQFQGMTAGNILLGGFIGLAVDAASGAMAQYPPTITVILPPQQFASIAERDNFFDARVAAVQRDFAERITQARSSCNASDPGCGPRVAAIEAERDAVLAQLATQRSTARVT